MGRFPAYQKGQWVSSDTFFASCTCENMTITIRQRIPLSGAHAERAERGVTRVGSLGWPRGVWSAPWLRKHGIQRDAVGSAFPSRRGARGGVCGATNGQGRPGGRLPGGGVRVAEAAIASATACITLLLAIGSLPACTPLDMPASGAFPPTSRYTCRVWHRLPLTAIHELLANALSCASQSNRRAG